MPVDVAAAGLRVSIGEDDVLLREGIARILTDAGLDVVVQCGDAEDLLRRTLAYRPDVAVIDVQMPPRHQDDGLVAPVAMRRLLPGTGVLVLSQFSPIAASPSQTSVRGTAPSCCSNPHQPANRSSPVRDGISTAVSHLEYADTITSTGSCIAVRTCAGWPAPTGICTSGNHKSHWAISPGP